MDDVVGLELKGNRGTYVIEQLVARGGRSNVFRAVWKEQQEYVCIKILSFQLDDASLRHLQREETITSKLHHPNIIRVFDTSLLQGFFCTVMELAEKSLADHLRINRPMQISEVVPIVMQIAGALDYVHKKGIVHGDVKPGNILLDGDRAILADFGIARVVGETITSVGPEVGTPAYMSPEQLSGERPGNQSDQYALAIVVFEMLTGRPPFVGANPYEIIYQKVTVPPPSLRVTNSSVTEAIDRVVLKALSKDPSGRYDGVLQFANELSRAAQLFSGTRSVQPTKPSKHLKQEVSRIDRQDLLVIALVTCISGFLGSLVGLLATAILLQALSR